MAAAVVVYCPHAQAQAQPPPADGPAAADPASQPTGPGAADKQKARDAVRQGDKQRKAGAPAEALAQYRIADGIMGVPTTRMRVANTLRTLGRLIEAREVARSVATIDRPADEPDAFVAARQKATQLVTELQADIAVVSIRLLPVRTAPSNVVLDGKQLTPADLASPMELDPGVHRWVVEAPGYQRLEQSTMLSKGQRDPVSLTMLPSTQSSGPAPGMGDGGGGAGGSISPVAWIGFGVAGAGLIAGIATGVVAGNLKDELNCPNNSCPPEQHDDLDAANSMAHGSTASFIIAGAGVALGVIGLFALSSSGGDEVDASDADAALTLQPYLTPFSAGVVGTF